jgi:hypothetical protein
MATTSMPARANTSTMPAPMVPRPTTPTRANSRATSETFLPTTGDRDGRRVPPVPGRDPATCGDVAPGPEGAGCTGR